MEIVLTGAGGFLGREVYKAFTRQGHTVLPVVRKACGFPGEIKFDLLGESYGALEELIQQCDCVVHLAAKVNFSDVFDENLFAANVISTIKIARIADDHQKHLIFASSVSIAQPLGGIISKETKDFPASEYALTKYIAEKAIENLHSSYCILRIAGIYGYAGPDHLFLNRAIMNALENNFLPSVAGDGRSKRNYIYVKDLANWIVNLAESRTNGKLLLAGNDISDMRTILTDLKNLYLPGKDVEFSEREASTNFIIRNDIPPVFMHTYVEAFKDILADFRAL